MNFYMKEINKMIDYAIKENNKRISERLADICQEFKCNYASGDDIWNYNKFISDLQYAIFDSERDSKK